MTEAQQQQYIAFVANFLSLLHEETSASYEQAEALLGMAVATLLGAVFDILPPDGGAEPDNFIMGVMQLGLKREYASVKVHD